MGISFFASGWRPSPLLECTKLQRLEPLSQAALFLWGEAILGHSLSNQIVGCQAPVTQSAYHGLPNYPGITPQLITERQIITGIIETGFSLLDVGEIQVRVNLLVSCRGNTQFGQAIIYIWIFVINTGYFIGGKRSNRAEIGRAH